MCAKHFKRQFTKEDVWMANRYIKRWTPSVAIKKMQINTTRHHYTPSRIAKNERLTLPRVVQDVKW